MSQETKATTKFPSSTLLPFEGLSGILRKTKNPARRHRCMLCHIVFECHICEINKWHMLHSEQHSILVCEDCIASCNLELIVIATEMSPSVYFLTEYSLLTGYRTARGRIAILPFRDIAIDHRSYKLLAKRPGRVRGSRSAQAKITEEQAVVIKYSSDHYSVLMETYGLCRSTIWNIQNGKNWNHLAKKKEGAVA